MFHEHNNPRLVYLIFFHHVLTRYQLEYTVSYTTPLSPYLPPRVVQAYKRVCLMFISWNGSTVCWNYVDYKHPLNSIYSILCVKNNYVFVKREFL